jgi:hypothetical protein
MGTPHKEYRENPDRAVYITGRISQELVDRITPRINKLRLDNTEPITAYVDSPGGSIALAEVIRNLIKAPNPDGFNCRLITAVTGGAASAAADFLALGDYAIAYPHTQILYHGSRQELDDAVTSQMASSLASSLRQTNEFFAIRLARCAFPRFVLRVSQFKEEFQRYINAPALALLTTVLRRKLKAPNGRLLTAALRKQKIITALSTSVENHFGKFKNAGADLPPSEFEMQMLKAIMKYRARIHKKESWLLSFSGLEEITEDFNLLHDFHFGTQARDLQKLDRTYGQLFLSDSEKEKYKSFSGSDDDKTKLLSALAEPKIQPIWYFMVSLCRLLQEDDYELGAQEAYWLGIVDEVPGSGLPNIREMAENVGAAPGATEQPSI